MSRFTDEYIDHLVKQGGLIDVGVDSGGSHVVVPTEKLKELDPEFYALKMDCVGLAAMSLWMLNFVDIRAFTEDGGSGFTIDLLPKALDDNEVKKLSDELKDDLEQFKVILGGKCQH